ncbi:MAG: GTP-dependent dephospho-CoA kinase family protein [Candidatus Anstonellaceae archaeon]
MDKKLRKLLSKPYGKIYKTNKELKKLLENLKGYRYLITIGDQSTYTLLSLGIVPDLAVFDKKIKRKKAPIKFIKLILSKAKTLLKANNPPSTISLNLIRKFSAAIKKKKPAFIEIKGEEDLASIVALKFCTKKDIIFYGQPNKGIVHLKVNKKLKAFASKIINLLKI